MLYTKLIKSMFKVSKEFRYISPLCIYKVIKLWINKVLEYLWLQIPGNMPISYCLYWSSSVPIHLSLLTMCQRKLNVINYMKYSVNMMNMFLKCLAKNSCFCCLNTGDIFYWIRLPTFSSFNLSNVVPLSQS